MNLPLLPLVESIRDAMVEWESVPAPEQQQDQTEELDPAIQGARCAQLWDAALAEFVKDAIQYATGTGKPPPELEIEGRAAFDDVCSLGPMTRHLCQMADVEPGWLLEQVKAAILEIRDGNLPPPRRRRGGRQ